MVVCYGICWCAHTNPYILLYYHGIDRFLLFPFLLRVPIRNRTKKIWPKIPQMSHYNIILHMIFWAHFPISHLGDSFIPAFFYFFFFFSRCFCKVLKLDIGIFYMRRFKLKKKREKTLNLIHQFISNSAFFYFYLFFLLLLVCFTFHLDISWLCVRYANNSRSSINSRARRKKNIEKLPMWTKKNQQKKNICIWRMTGTTERNRMNRG